MSNWLENESKNLTARFIGVNRAAFARENEVPGGQANIPSFKRETVTITAYETSQSVKSTH